MSLFVNLLGGVGLFLLGMHLMTEGMKLAAGHALRSVLARSAGTCLRGVLSGAAITSLVQSSSAVTVATIGFVNAGLLTLSQAVAITYGSNIGTTMTGWLVAVIGFHFKIQLFALPAIGIGMFMRLIGRSQRLSAIGEALAGFGIFFLAIAMLKDGFTGMGHHLPLASTGTLGPLDLVLFVGSGFAMTVLTQSSSAAIALVLTAAGSGVLAIEAAAAMVIGANIGTTTTAVLAALGATPNARRVAAAHVLFNGITGLVALIILPLLLALLHTLQTRLSLESGAPMLLALFHTTFNLLGVALLWPFTGQLVRRLEGRFRLKEEDEARPRYLDRTTVATPVLALQALTLELAHAGHLVARMVRTVLGGETSSVRLERDVGVIAQLIDAIGDFTALMRRGSLPERLAEILPNAIGVSRYLNDTANLAVAISRMELAAMAPELAESAAQFRRDTEAVIDAATGEPGGEGLDGAETLARMQALSRQYQQLKSQTLQAGSLGHIPVRQVVELVEMFKDIERLADHLVKAAALLAAMRAVAANEPEPPAEPTAAADGPEA